MPVMKLVLLLLISFSSVYGSDSHCGDFYLGLSVKGHFHTPRTLPAHVKNPQFHLKGESGFFKKIDLIERAVEGSTIELAYFIFESDYSSSFLASKMIEASQRGVKVNILIDYFMAQSHLEFLTYLNSHKGIEIKLFRPASPDFVKYLESELQMKDSMSFLTGLAKQDIELIKKGAMSSHLLQEILASEKIPAENIFTIKKMSKYIDEYLNRLHHKSLSAMTDKGIEFIVGGRNISDEYHIGLPELKMKDKGLLNGRSYPFIDAEVSGIVESLYETKSFLDSFKRLWSGAPHLYSNLPSKALSSLSLEKAKGELDHKVAVFKSQQNRLRKRAQSGFLQMAGELPAKYAENLYSGGKKTEEIITVWRELIEKAVPEQGAVRIISAYLYLYPEIMKSMKVALDKGVSVELYTNSFTSTDLAMVNLASYKKMEQWLDFFEHNPKLKIFELNLAKGEGSLHAKIIQVGDVIGVGSANLDPRSFTGDTNNVMFFYVKDHQEMAVQFFSEYLDNKNLPWSELTLEKAKYLLNEAQKVEVNQLFLKLLNLSLVENEI